MPELLTTLFVIGIVAESMTAAVAAGRMRMDLFGVITLGALTGLGGERCATSSWAPTP